jgi:hypothetical protein
MQDSRSPDLQSSNQPATVTAMTETNVQDLHIVVAALESQGQFVGYCAVTAPLTYNEALEVWERKQRLKIGVNARRNRGHVREYAVRSVADPRFAPLVGRGYADAVSRWTDREGVEHVGKGRLRGSEKAAMAWAKEFGYKGRGGGWIEDANGGIVCQGWGSFATMCRSAGRIAQGSDGKWYVIDRELVK